MSVVDSHAHERTGNELPFVASGLPRNVRHTADHPSVWYAASSFAGRKDAGPVGCTGCRRTGCRTWKTTGWLFTVYIVCLALAFTVCRPALEASVFGGVQRRRLAEDGDREDGDESRSSTPELLDFCIDLAAEWMPSEGDTGESRASPTMVENYFECLKLAGSSFQGEQATLSEEGEEAAARSSGVKRPAPDDESEDEQPGPSWQLARTDHLHGASQPAGPELPRHSPVASATSDDASSEESGSQGPQVRHGDSTLDELFQRSADRPLQRGIDGTPKHPFVRIASLKPGVKPREFDQEFAASSYSFTTKFSPVMRDIRELLLQPELDEFEANALVLHAELLVSHGRRMLTEPILPFGASLTVSSLGQRFLLFNTLYAVSKALGQSWQRTSWWRELAELVTSGFPYTPQQTKRMRQEYVRLGKMLNSAVNLYKVGLCPSESTVIEIKRLLFCMPDSPMLFRARAWQPWRDDDNEFNKTK